MLSILIDYDILIWHHEWYQAWGFIVQLSQKERKVVKFDPQLLSKNISYWSEKSKKKKKHNVAKKKILMVATIGLPVLFSMYLYNYKNKYNLPFRLNISEESRKKNGKKEKK